MIIGITGKIGSGKTTLAKYLVEHHNYIEYGMADPIKEIGRIFGFTNEQMYGTQEQKLQQHPYWKVSGRKFLQVLGTDVFRKLVPGLLPDTNFTDSVWADVFRLKYEQQPNLYVISDVRFLNEERLIRKLGGIIIRTVRNNQVSSPTGEEHKHASELEMSQIKPDYTINNDELTILESRNRVDEILQMNLEKITLIN